MADPVAFTARERPELSARATATVDAWPVYNTHGDVLNRYWGRLEPERPDFQFVLCDPETEEVLGQGHSIPVRWDGTAEGLPPGIDGAIAGGFEDEGEPTALCALAIELPAEHRGRGVSPLMVRAMARIAAAHGLQALIAPVRPSWKERYPLTPIERYATWRRPDGLLFDPWLRVHERLGAAVLRPEPQSLRISGTVGDWEEWTGMPFPDSGEYVFPHGLATLHVDRDADSGAYWEPNVWMRHPG